MQKPIGRRQRSKPTVKNDTQPATESGTQPATIGGTQPATSSGTQPAKSGTQPATIDGTQPATESGIQYAKSGIQPATENGIQYATENGTQPATESGILLTMVGLSKGQERVLKYLMSICDTQNPSQTVPVGYDIISRSCFLSRNGARKVMSELCRKGLIRHSETKRGEHQGTVYFLESSAQYATKSGIPNNLESSAQYATFGDTSCSSSLKKQQLQTLIREDTFQDLNPQSLLPYLDQFDTTEQLQIFLDMANACIAAAQAGKGKPIQNPQGFLFAQLKAGYINPPEGFKSRKVRVQESRNQQLEEELATLRQLKERERALQFELFREKLTEEQRERLEQEARAQYKPGLGLSEGRQIEIAKGEIVKQWFEEWGQMDAETTT